MSIYLLLAAICMVSCEEIEGEGAIKVKEYKLSTSISSIDVGSAIRLELSDDVAPGLVKIETYSNIFEYVNFKTDHDDVEIWMENKRYDNDVVVTVYASAAQYDSVEASGATRVTLVGEIDSPTYEIDLSGASSFVMSGNFDDMVELTIDASGASKAQVAGSVSKCEVDASGASTIDARDLTCQYLDVELSGATDLTIGVSSAIEGELSGASTLYYSGDARVDVETTGASQIKKF